jgi:hypothetical protein
MKFHLVLLPVNHFNEMAAVSFAVVMAGKETFKPTMILLCGKCWRGSQHQHMGSQHQHRIHATICT